MKLLSVVVMVALLALPVVAGAPVCPPVEEEGVWMCVDGEAILMEGRVTIGVSMHMFGNYWIWDGSTWTEFDDANYYRTFLRVGYEHPVYENMFIRTGLSIENPYSPFNSWYIVETLGKYHLTDALSVLVGLDFGIEMDQGTIRQADWTLPIGGHYAFGGMDPGLGIWLTAHIGPAFDPDMPFFEAFFSGGIEFRF